MYQTNLKYNIETPPKYPQSFTGKERDSETGFSYFGARYYDSDILTSWLSVDPLADKYPSLSPYNYCAWNPVKLVDPDGEEIIAALVGAVINASVEIVSQTISNGFDNLDNGKGFFDKWDANIDWFDVGVSAVEGFANGAIPGTGKAAKLAIEGGSMALRASADLCANKNSDGKITFRSILSKGDNRKKGGELGIDICGELTSFALGRVTQINNIPFQRESFVECAFETGLRGSFSGIVNTPFEYWKTNYMQRNSSRIIIEPIQINLNHSWQRYLPHIDYYTQYINYNTNR